MKNPDFPDIGEIELKAITNPKILSVVLAFKYNISIAESEDALANLLELAVINLDVLSSECDIEEILTATVEIGQFALSANSRLSLKRLAGDLKQWLTDMMDGEPDNDTEVPKN